jgi:cation transport ATPase
MEIILVALVIGLIPAAIAQSKGHSFLSWWFYGAALFIVALPHALLISANVVSLEEQQITEGGKKCSYCAEIVKRDARFCRYCGRAF